MRTNTSLNLTYQNKERHNQPTILHTHTTVNLHIKNQSKIIISNANKKASYRTSTSNGKNKHSDTSPIINKILLMITIIMRPTTKI